MAARVAKKREYVNYINYVPYYH